MFHICIIIFINSANFLPNESVRFLPDDVDDVRFSSFPSFLFISFGIVLLVLNAVMMRGGWAVTANNFCRICRAILICPMTIPCMCSLLQYWTEWCHFTQVLGINIICATLRIWQSNLTSWAWPSKWFSLLYIVCFHCGPSSCRAAFRGVLEELESVSRSIVLRGDIADHDRVKSRLKTAGPELVPGFQFRNQSLKSKGSSFLEAAVHKKKKKNLVFISLVLIERR